MVKGDKVEEALVIALSEFSVLPEVSDPLNSHFAILSQDRNGKLNFYNIAAQEVFGYTPDEALGMPSINLVPEHLWVERSREFQGVLEKLVMKEFTTVRLNKDGNEVCVAARAFLYGLNGDKNIAAVVRKKNL